MRARAKTHFLQNKIHDMIQGSKNNYTPEEVLLDYLEIKYYLSGSCNCSTCEKCLLVRLMEEI